MGHTTPMHVLRTARAIVTYLVALPALLVGVHADDLDDVWEPFLGETYD